MLPSFDNIFIITPSLGLGLVPLCGEIRGGRAPTLKNKRRQGRSQ